MRTLCPGARLGNCLRHALNKLPKKLAAIASPVRKALRTQFHTLLHRARQRKGLRVFALGQRLRRFANHVTTMAGAANGERVRRWFHDKKAGWYAVLEDPQMPATSTLLDQAHNAIERKLSAMKGFHHPQGSQQAFLTGLAHLYNLIPYQRRAKHAGQCGVAVEGGRLPTADWFLNLRDSHLGRLSLSDAALYHVIRWSVKFRTLGIRRNFLMCLFDTLFLFAPRVLSRGALTVGFGFDAAANSS